MAIKTRQGIGGFIASEPRLENTSRGEPRFYARIGIEHWQPTEDGSFTKLETTFHDMVQFGKSAKHSHERFQKGDNFIAAGYVRTRERIIDGEPTQFEEFVARRLGHDAARSKYTVGREPRSGAFPVATVDLDTLDNPEPATSASSTETDSPAV